MDSEKRILNVTLEGHKAGRQAGFTPPCRTVNTNARSL